MKFTKILAAALAVLSFTACNDDDELNTLPVSVSMQQSTMSVGEDVAAGVYYNVPVVLSGKTNGPVTVTVDVEGVGSDPANEGEDFVITEKTITIAAGEEIGYIQFYPVGDKIVNEDREVLFTIKSAQGASIGTESTCKVTFIDNEKFLAPAYSDLIGTWNMTTDAGTFPVEITGYEEGEEGYLEKVTIHGINGQSWCTIEGNFSLDASTMECSITMPYGQIIAEDVTFNGIGTVDIALASFDGSSLSLNGRVVATSNPEQTMYVWNSGVCGALMLGGQFEGHIWFGYLSVTMTKAH